MVLAIDVAVETKLHLVVKPGHPMLSSTPRPPLHQPQLSAPRPNPGGVKVPGAFSLRCNIKLRHLVLPLHVGGRSRLGVSAGRKERLRKTPSLRLLLPPPLPHSQLLSTSTRQLELLQSSSTILQGAQRRPPAPLERTFVTGTGNGEWERGLGAPPLLRNSSCCRKVCA